MADEVRNEQAGAQAPDTEERLAAMERLLGAHNQFLRQQISQQEAAEQQQRQQQSEAQQQQEQQGRLRQVHKAWSEYPDQKNLEGAFNHIANGWADEAKKYGMADEDIEEGVMGGLKNLALSALENKMNPANVVYQYALQQGFKPEEAQQAAEQATAAAVEESGAAGGAAAPKKGAGFVDAVKAGKRPPAGGSGGNGDSFKAAMAAKAAGDMDKYASLMAG